MSKFKRVTSGLVGVAMAASMFTSMPFSAFAEDEAETNNQTYVYDDYEVSYQVTNSWGDTEVVSITLSNTGDSTIEDWMLYFDPNGEVQYTTDCQQLTTSDGISYFKNSGYNADVAPDSSVTFGYAVNDCEAVPESFTLCQKRGTKTDGYTVSLNVNQSWGDSFSGEIVIQNNTDTAIEAWELTIDTNFTITEITNSWAATVTELEPYSYLLKGTYTGTVAANSSVSLGFIGVKDGEPEISSYSLTEVQVDADYVTLLHCYEDWENLPDTDGDGLPDLYEQLIGTDAAVADTDQDQLPDGYEVKTLNSDIQNGLSAFVAYLYDNYDCKIKQMPLEELNHMNKIEKRFKSFLASVCVFAFLCFGSTSVVALESSGSIKNIGWSISSDTLLLEDENGNWNAIFEGNICTVNGLILSASCVTFEELFSEENGDLFEWLSEHPIDTLSINVEVLDSIASEDHLIGNVDTLIIGKNVQSIRNDSFLDVKYLKNVYIYSSNIDLTNTGIGFSYEGELSDIVMYGYIGSTTETYANENGFTFIALDADPNTTTTTTDVIITTTDTTTVTTANSTETITETTTISNVESTVTTTETNFTTIGDMTTETVETTDSTSNTTTVANIVEVDETKALTDSSTTTELTSDIAKVDETAKAASTETSTNTTETTSTTTTTTDDTTLPQTGYSKWYHVVVILAACMTGTGAVMVIGSGALKRKQK